MLDLDHALRLVQMAAGSVNGTQRNAAMYSISAGALHCILERALTKRSGSSVGWLWLVDVPQGFSEPSSIDLALVRRYQHGGLGAAARCGRVDE